MKLTTLLAIIGIATLAAACTETASEPPTEYPLSGQECSPDDPVQDLSVQQCADAA